MLSAICCVDVIIAAKMRVLAHSFDMQSHVSRRLFVLVLCDKIGFVYRSFFLQQRE